MKTNSEKHYNFAQKHVNILGVRLDSTNETEVLNAVKEKISRKIQFYIVTPNPEIIVMAQSDPELAHSLRLAHISIPDGVGLKFAAKLQGEDLKIIKGRELMIDILKLASREKWKVFLLGGREIVNQKAIKEIKNKFPAIKIDGISGPKLDNEAMPVSEADINIQSDVVKRINEFAPHILYVAFGTPKEQKWMSIWLPKLKVIGAMEVGGSFDYLAGEVNLPPKWISELGLEWLWRLGHEPKRLKRIFNAVVVFPILVIKSKLNGH